MAASDFKSKSHLGAISGRVKGVVTVAHNAISAGASSAEIATKGFNAIIIETVITVAAKLWTVKVQGCLSTGGTFADCYDGATLMSSQTNSSKIVIWKGLPPFIKLNANEDEDTGKCTVRYMLINV